MKKLVLVVVVGLFLGCDPMDVPEDTKVEEDTKIVVENSDKLKQQDIKKINNAVLKNTKILIDKGTNLNEVDKEGRTPLSIASRTDSREAVRLLIGTGADVDARDEDKRTALMWASMFNENPEMIQLLIDAGADVNARDDTGRTALTYALRRDNKEVIKVLEENGAIE